MPPIAVSPFAYPLASAAGFPLSNRLPTLPGLVDFVVVTVASRPLVHQEVTVLADRYQILVGADDALAVGQVVRVFGSGPTTAAADMRVTAENVAPKLIFQLLGVVDVTAQQLPCTTTYACSSRYVQGVTPACLPSCLPAHPSAYI